MEQNLLNLVIDQTSAMMRGVGWLVFWDSRLFCMLLLDLLLFGLLLLEELGKVVVLPHSNWHYLLRELELFLPWTFLLAILSRQRYCELH